MAFNSDGRDVYNAGTSDQDPKTFQFPERVAYVQVAQADTKVYSTPRTDAAGNPVRTVYKPLATADVGVSGSAIAYSLHPGRRLLSQVPIRALSGLHGNRKALQQDTMGMHFRDPLDAFGHDGVFLTMVNGIPSENMADLLSQIEVEGGINESQQRGTFVDGTNQYGNALGLAVTGIVPLHLHKSVVRQPPILSNAYAVPIHVTDDSTGPQKTLRIVSGNEITHLFGISHRLRQYAEAHRAIHVDGMNSFTYEDGALENPTSMPHVTMAAGEFHRAAMLNSLMTALMWINAFPDTVGAAFDSARASTGGDVLQKLADCVDAATNPAGGVLSQRDINSIQGILRSANQSGSVSYTHLTTKFGTSNPGQPIPPLFASVDIASNGAAGLAAIIRHPDMANGKTVQSSVMGTHPFVTRALSMANQPETFSPAARLIQIGQEFDTMTKNLHLGVITKANVRSGLVMVKKVDH